MKTNLLDPQRLFGGPVRYEIPRFQRRYVWKQEEQWEPLWRDVKELAQSIVDDDYTGAHFLGAIVLQAVQFPTGTIPRRIVVDGQQRLTTLQLLIDAIRQVLEHKGHSSPAKRLLTLTANDEAFRDDEPDNAFKVWPTVVDQIAYRYAMRSDLSAGDHARSRIVQAHEYFKCQAERWLDSLPDETPQSPAADALEDAVRTKLDIVVIDLAPTDNPHIIFETLNARGTRLLQSDMVKNKILYEYEQDILTSNDGGESTDESRLWPFGAEEWWNKDVGRGLQRRPRVDVYLNHWLTLRNRAETKPYDEFRAFQKYADARKKQGDTIKDIAFNLADLGCTYRDVEDVRRADIATFLKRCKVMNVGVATPLLLWLLSNDLPSPTLQNCIRVLESFLVRRVVCRYNARRYGKLFVGLIQELDGRNGKDVDDVFISYLATQTAPSTLWPSDDELLEAFLTSPLYWYLTRGRLRMVIEGIEEELHTDKSESSVVPDKLPIEHIMPQTWSPHYPLPNDGDNVDVEGAVARRNRAIHTIGNLTLVTSGLNSAMSNAPWNEKRKTLADHSVLFLNKQLVNEGPDTWDEAAIEKRAEWLHSVASKVWPHCDGIKVG